jgi:alkyldihydroxyacetonephosphate synthase
MVDHGFDGRVLLPGSRGVESVAATERDWQRRVALEAGGELGSEPVDRWLDRQFDFSSVQRHLALPGGYAEIIEMALGWRHSAALYALKSRLGPLADEVNAHFSHAYIHGTSLCLIVGFSTSGSSENLAAPATETARVQECQLVLTHIVCDYVDAYLTG